MTAPSFAPSISFYEPVILHLLGYPSQAIGYGVHTLSLYQALVPLAGSLGLNLVATDLSASDSFEHLDSVPAIQDCANQLIHLYIADPSVSLVPPKYPGKHVLYTVFESSVLPLGWKEACTKFDLILTASHWGANILRQALPSTPIGVVPEGVDPILHHRWNRTGSGFQQDLTSPSSESGSDIFTFLSVGKFEVRKSYQELVQAFISAFPPACHKVRLLLRLHNIFYPKYVDEVNALTSQPGAEGRILVVNNLDSGEFLSPTTLASLYRSAHCFVFPSKGEGWGLPLIEAISCGTPYLATHYSGHTEYLSHCSQPYSQIDYNLNIIRDPGYLRFHRFLEADSASWAVPCVDHLASQMRLIHDNWAEVYRSSARNSEIVQSMFSWQASARRLIDVLSGLFPSFLSYNNSTITLQEP